MISLRNSRTARGTCRGRGINVIPPLAERLRYFREWRKQPEQLARERGGRGDGYRGVGKGGLG